MSLEDEKYGEIEEIIIADTADDNDDEVHAINEEFTQESTIKGIKRSFVIFNDKQLLQSLKSFRNKEGKPYRINLRYVSPEPVRDRRYAWRLLAATGICLTLMVLLACVWHFTRFNSYYLLVAASLFAAASMIALLLFFHNSHDTFIYTSLAAGVPLIELDNRKPSLREFDAFLHKLEQYIRKAHECGVSRQQLLAGELRDIRRLKDDGMLSEETYEHARTQIFRHKEYSVSR